jgi:hypothetical protein
MCYSWAILLTRCVREDRTRPAFHLIKTFSCRQFWRESLPRSPAPAGWELADNGGVLVAAGARRFGSNWLLGLAGVGGEFQ